MKILWLRPSKGDNISVRRERIAEKLRESGHEVTIRDASGTDLPKAVLAAFRGDFDVIAGNVRIGLYIGYPLARILRTPFLGDVSDPISDIEYLPGPLFSFFQWYEWQVLKRADATVFVYQSSLREARKKGIEDAVHLPNAVDYELFAQPDQSVVAEAGEILDKEGVDADRPIAIYIGVFSKNYCIEAILETAARVQEWEFVFVGEGGHEERAVREAAANRSNVYYPGAFEYRLIPGFLAHADAGFCFKDAEQPLKLKEYGAAGLPTIVRPGALSAFYSDEELIFTPPDSTSIGPVLNRLTANTQYRRQYGQRLQERVQGQSWQRISDEYQSIFEAMVE